MVALANCLKQWNGNSNSILQNFVTKSCFLFKKEQRIFAKDLIATQKNRIVTTVRENKMTKTGSWEKKKREEKDASDRKRKSLATATPEEVTKKPRLRSAQSEKTVENHPTINTNVQLFCSGHV